MKMRMVSGIASIALALMAPQAASAAPGQIFDKTWLAMPNQRTPRRPPPRPQ